MSWRVWVLMLGYLALDVGAVAVWRTERTVWAQAYRQAPHAVRVTTNYAQALYAEGRDREAQRLTP